MTDDWFDMIRALQDASARFLLVGTHALAVHGVPRGTQDLDLWIEPTPENAQKVWEALDDFGAPAEQLDISLDDLVAADSVI
jgi:hypothetical protein